MSDFEIKSMFVHPDARGKGLAHKLMQAVEAEARAQLPGVLLEGEDAASVGRGWWSLPRISIDVDGRPPEGESCP